jgi:hypothetical protein
VKLILWKRKGKYQIPSSTGTKELLPRKISKLFNAHTETEQEKAKTFFGFSAMLVME